MGFKEFIEQRHQEKERIKAEDKLWAARTELLNTYVRGGREIVEGYGLEMNSGYEDDFRQMMSAAIESGYEPSMIEQVINTVSRKLSKMNYLSPPEGGQVFCALVRAELERGFSIEVFQ